MAEIRKQLTDIQFRSLLSAQLEFQQAETVFNAAKKRLDEISSIILDALKINTSSVIQIDAQKKELVVSE